MGKCNIFYRDNVWKFNFVNWIKLLIIFKIMSYVIKYFVNLCKDFVVMIKKEWFCFFFKFIMLDVCFYMCCVYIIYVMLLVWFIII